jgi:hypothetical protein
VLDEQPGRVGRQPSDDGLDQAGSEPQPAGARVEVELVQDVVGTVSPALRHPDEPTSRLRDDDETLGHRGLDLLLAPPAHHLPVCG